MSKIKYRYNTKSLTYERATLTVKQVLWRVFSYLGTGTVFAALTVFVAYNYFDSPKEKLQAREIETLKLQLEVLNGRMDEAQTVLSDLQYRDNNIYRVVFEAEPIPAEVRQAGFGGVDRYKDLQGMLNSELLTQAAMKMDKLGKQLYVQSKSFDEVVKLAKGKEQMLSSIPAIQPINNKNLHQMASGYGWRTHPIYKISHFHSGMDFAANTGTEIFSTGDGVVAFVKSEKRGYGNHVVVRHGYGYQTLYAHMSKFAVRAGQKVKRGDVIGYVGSTGTSTAPHLHYEVIKNNEKINPVNFYYNDLSPADYERMIELASTANQSFD